MNVHYLCIQPNYSHAQHCTQFVKKTCRKTEVWVTRKNKRRLLSIIYEVNTHTQSLFFSLSLILLFNHPRILSYPSLFTLISKFRTLIRTFTFSNTTIKREKGGKIYLQTYRSTMEISISENFPILNTIFPPSHVFLLKCSTEVFHFVI